MANTDTTTPSYSCSDLLNKTTDEYQERFRVFRVSHARWLLAYEALIGKGNLVKGGPKPATPAEALLAVASVRKLEVNTHFDGHRTQVSLPKIGLFVSDTVQNSGGSLWYLQASWHAENLHAIALLILEELNDNGCL